MCLAGPDRFLVGEFGADASATFARGETNVKVGPF
jgi:hypothetical protein